MSEPVDKEAAAEALRLYVQGRALLALGLKAEGDKLMVAAGEKWALGWKGREWVERKKREMGRR